MQDDNDTVISHGCRISLIRFMNNRLVPTSFTLDLTLEFSADFEQDDLDFALDKFEYWIENHVNDCVAVAYDNEMAFSMLLEGHSVRVGNTLMITPTEPDDIGLLMVLASKMNAFSKGVFTVEFSRFLPERDGLTVGFTGNPSNLLPPMDKWINGKNWFKHPWWNRDDCSTIDSVMPEGSDPKELPDWASNLDFLREEPTAPPIIIRGNFTPTIIEG